jgi:hypothetical protein
VGITNGVLTIPVNILSCSGNSISFIMPPAVSGTSFTITFTGPINTVTHTYSTSSYLTPTASITSPTNLTVGSNTITFAATNGIAASINNIQLVSTFNNSYAITIPSATWTTNGTGSSAVTNFTATLSAGSYSLIVSTTPNGYIAVTGTINVLLPTSITTNSQQVSFNGGTFTIAATYLSPVSSLSVNGFTGQLTSYNTSSATYAIPPLVTPTTQTTFNLKTVSLLPNSLFTLFSDTNNSTFTSGNVSATFDGLVNTFYGSSNPICWIGLDSGAGMQASVSRISFFPDLHWTNVASQILYAVFQGSNDMVNWHNLAIIDQTIHTGWNVLQSTDNTPYRYVRFLHNSTSQCNIAEIQLYGILYSIISASLTSQFTNVIYNDGFNSKTFTNAV